jgi:DNA-binding transcriptional LysR family regulator
MIPSSTEIAHFMEVYQIRHISKAALRLGVTQPTLTQSLQRLEQKLKTKLFFRTKQGVVPTPQAYLFLSRAKALSECWVEIRDGVLSSQTDIAGTFRVGCHQSVAAYTTPALLRNLKEAPGLHVNFVHDFSRKITEGVVSYDLDMGYVVNPARHPDLILKKLGTDRVTFWRSKTHQEVPKRILADVSLKQVEEFIGKTFDKHFKGWELVQSSSLELIRTLTRQGLGVGVLPERVAMADGPHLVVHDKNLPSRPDEIFLAYRRELLASRAGKELVRLAAFPLD